MTTNTGHEAVLPSHIDVKADARVIKSVADETIQTILNKRAEMDRAGLDLEPLFVALGEDHWMTAHKLHQLAVLDGLRRAGEPLAMAFEKPHNQLIRIYEKGGHQPTPASDGALRRQDREISGAHTLENYIAFCGAEQSDHTDKAVMQYCCKTDTPSAFTDAAVSDDYLDTSDAATRGIIASCRGRIQGSRSMSCTEPKGMHVRNHHMLRCARQTAGQYDSQIILQHTGYNHVAGNRFKNYRACDSLLGLSRNFFSAALGFVPLCSGWSEGHLDVDGEVDQDQYLCRRLPEIEAAYNPFTDAPMKGADLPSRAAEAEYLSRVLHAMGLGEHVISVKAYQEQRAAYQKEFQQLFAAIDRRTRAQATANPA